MNGDYGEGEPMKPCEASCDVCGNVEDRADLNIDDGFGYCNSCNGALLAFYPEARELRVKDRLFAHGRALEVIAKAVNNHRSARSGMPDCRMWKKAVGS